METATPERPSGGPQASRGGQSYGQAVAWAPATPRFRPLRLLVSWLVSGLAVLVAAAVLPGVSTKSLGSALLAAALIALLNAVLPPIVAALRLPFTVGIGFGLVLVVDALILKLVSDLSSNAIHVDSLGWAFLAALVIAAATVVLDVILGANDDDTYSLRVTRRIARRQGVQTASDDPGIIFLEIDGLALPVLQRAMRDGQMPELARWIERGSHRLLEWETDLSSQTGASQAGILLGSNTDIPAFRWVEKESGRVMTCSSPADCAEIESRLARGNGLLLGGGASRGNLFSGEAEAVILTVSRMQAEKRANPGYRAFLANGFNVTRTLVLFAWEVALELIAAARQRRRDVLPRGSRGGIYPLVRAAVCVPVRDLIVFGVLTDMMRGRPAVYATFSSYDEVAHHSGLERADTLEALRKLDQQFGRIDRARAYAPRPYELLVLSDHGQTQGATFRQRNGYDLEALVEEHLDQASVTRVHDADENDAAVAHAVSEATGRTRGSPSRHVEAGQAIVLASGNLGLVYLMEVARRLCLEEIEVRHPRLLPALRGHPHIGFLLVHSRRHGPVVLGPRGARYLDADHVSGEDPLGAFSPRAPQLLRRSAGFAHAPDIMINSFYDRALDQGCAFEELISFHGGLGGPQTRPFILHPARLPGPTSPIVGAVGVHEVLMGWRRELQGAAATPAEPDPPPAQAVRSAAL